jgi:hypothetical protein
MSLIGLLNQTISIYNKSSYSSQGREVVGTALEVDARIQETTKQKLSPTGSLTTINAIAYVPGDTVVAIDDRIDYANSKYKVFGVYGAVDGEGKTDHIKLELVRWKET